MPVVNFPIPLGDQIAIVGAPIAPMAVIACAGSGKTLTAVHRVAAMSRILRQERGRIALLSFSNIAVETFRQAYRSLTGSSPNGSVQITTLDSFITTNILKPHAHRTMGHSGVPFLVSGSEQFLSGFNIQATNFPISVTRAQCERVNGNWQFFHIPVGTKVVLPAQRVSRIVRRLGQVGAYTHNLGRFWAYETLVDQPAVLRSLANRYKHILIDEAQDIGTAHEAFLHLLAGQGVQVSLIGDPNQAIYDFTGANGNFLRNYRPTAGTNPYELTENRRSVLPILAVANKISGRNDTPTRALPPTIHGAFYTTYNSNSPTEVIDRFTAALTGAGLPLTNSAVLCRANDLCGRLKGESAAPGVGMVSKLARAAIKRDILKDYSSAFTTVIEVFSNLLDNLPKDFCSSMNSSESDAPFRRARQILWAFASRPETGLPSVLRNGKTQWHPELMTATRAVLQSLETECGFSAINNLGQKLTRRDLPDGPISSTAQVRSRIRVDTVHQAKGESLDAVLYIASKEHAERMLEGVGTEVGRIGYVALTRTRDLFWVAVPQTALRALEPSLRAAGLSQL